MKKYILSIIFTLFVIQNVNAETITEAEYFFDLDPGYGQGSPLSPVDGSFDSAIEQVFSKDYHNLDPGIHVVNVRGKNSSGDWGPVRSEVFRVTKTVQNSNYNLYIAEAEFFFDDDPGEGNGFKLNAVDGDFDNALEDVAMNNIDLDYLSEGLHTVFVRGMRSDNKWGEVKSEQFIIDRTPPVITGLSNDFSLVKNKTWSWSAIDSSSVLFRYNIDQNTDWPAPSGTFSEINNAFISNTSGIWYLHVQAKDDAGNLSNVVSVAANLTNEIINKPPTPANLKVKSSSNKQVKLGWDFNSDVINISYIVYRSEMENGIFYKVNQQAININHVVYGEIEYTDKGLKNDRTYYYMVKSFLDGQLCDEFSNKVSARPHKIFNFQCNPINKTSKLVKVNNTVKYHFQLLKDEEFEGKINLTCNGLPDYLKYEFSINNNVQGSTVSITKLPSSVTLKIYAGSAADFGEHEFILTVQNTWSGGSSEFMKIPIKLTVVPNNENCIFVELDKSLMNDYGSQEKRNEKKISTKITEKTLIIDMGESVEIYGAISSYAEGENIVLSLKDQNGSSEEKNFKTTSGGKFSDKEWISTLPLGRYEISASWTDKSANILTSKSRKFTIVKGKSEITCLRRTDLKPELNKDFSIFGDLIPTVSYGTIVLRVISADKTYTDYNFQLDNSGHYEIFNKFFNQKGVWKFKAYWQGNETHIGCESDTLSVPVGIDFGRAIILAGGEAEENNMFWKVTTKLSVKAYNDFKFMGFTDDMIYYLINSQSVDINYDGSPDYVVDNNRPTVSTFLEAIENTFEYDLNADNPLFIYMVGHGTSDRRFKVLGSDQYVSVSQIKTALDNLQNKTGCQIVLILESCFSGSFINDLIGNNRVLISSTDNQRYIIDAKGEIVFSRFLFSNLSEGDSLGKAFQKSKRELSIFGYPPPLMIDDSENNDLSADNIFVTGQIHYGERVEINEVVLDNIVEENQSTLPVSVKASGDVDIHKVWAIIIAPNVNLLGEDQTITYPEEELTYNPENQTYDGMLTNLNIPGIYKVAFMAENIMHEVSLPYVEYISNTSIVKSGDINGDNKVDISDAIIGLKIICNYESYILSSLADIDGDNKIGLYEIVYILKTIGFRVNN